MKWILIFLVQMFDKTVHVKLSKGKADLKTT